MYNFIDVTEASEGYVLPSEALKINGEYIENLISGYRTLNVKGREALSPDVVSFSTGVRDGSKLKSKRYPERIITVTYQLIAESNEAFREAYNQLGGILDVEDAELIFNDEQDKFFKGTPCIIGDVKPGSNSVVGEFEILCTDPFKYSVIEYEAVPDLDESSVLIDYNGTYKAYPTLEADFYSEEEASEDGETVTELTGSGDCGYVAFFTEDEKIIQLGDPEEVDAETVYPKSQTLVNSSFKKSTGWGSAAKSQWGLNSGTATGTITQAGTVGMAVSTMTEAVNKATTTSGTLLTTKSTANAPTIHYQVTAKAANRTETSVKVTVSVKTWLDKDASYFGRGYGLTGHIYLGGSWRAVKIKDTTAYWRGKSGHTVNLSVTVTGLTASTTALTEIKFKVTRIDSLGTAGLLSETACKNLTISKYSVSTPETYYLVPLDFGSGSFWHGPTITRSIPADASGETGATNFTLSYAHKMFLGNTKNASSQCGSFGIYLTGEVDGSRKVVAGVFVQKSSFGKTANVHFYINGKLMEEADVTVDLSYTAKRFNQTKTSTITKDRHRLSFNIAGIKRFFINTDITNVAVDQVTIFMGQWGTKSALTYNGLSWVKFVKNNCETQRDIPNKFSANDVVEADCKNGEIYLNGVQAPELGALGNDWEDFCLTPGLNQIGVAYSDWVTAEYAPSFKVRYREVFL